jgi:hypothetical protein
MSYLLVSLPSSITQAAAYCIKKEMTLANLETSSDFEIISAIAKGKKLSANVTCFLPLKY